MNSPETFSWESQRTRRESASAGCTWSRGNRSLAWTSASKTKTHPNNKVFRWLCDGLPKVARHSGTVQQHAKTIFEPQQGKWDNESKTMKRKTKTHRNPTESDQNAQEERFFKPANPDLQKLQKAKVLFASKGKIEKKTRKSDWSFSSFDSSQVHLAYIASRVSKHKTASPRTTPHHSLAIKAKSRSLWRWLKHVESTFKVFKVCGYFREAFLLIFRLFHSLFSFSLPQELFQNTSAFIPLCMINLSLSPNQANTKNIEGTVWENQFFKRKFEWRLIPYQLRTCFLMFFSAALRFRRASFLREASFVRLAALHLSEPAHVHWGRFGRRAEVKSIFFHCALPLEKSSKKIWSWFRLRSQSVEILRFSLFVFFWFKYLLFSFWIYGWNTSHLDVQPYLLASAVFQHPEALLPNSKTCRSWSWSLEM